LLEIVEFMLEQSWFVLYWLLLIALVNLSEWFTM